jgi:ABC-type multidrug transport system fused ATPase/permease subunit
LDPFDQYDDEVIWSVVKKSHLHDKLTESGQGLEMKVANDGDNLSIGEKQLLCLGRALLRQNKILLLDEATASVDVETDYKIQATIKEAFADCTVVTIAHRIHTVMNYDKILVMKNGQVIESGAPQELLERHDGQFRSMMKSAQMMNI